MTYYNKCAALLLGTIINSAFFIQITLAQPIDEVIVFSSPFQKPVTEVISTTEVVDADALQTVIGKPIGDALAGLPGVDSANFGPAVGQPLIRGLGGFRVDTLVNSMSVGDIVGTGSDHANGLSLFDTERVEVLKGPAALRYGAFAATGVVNSFNRHMTKNAENSTDALLAYGDAADETMGAFFVRRNGFALSGFSQNADNLRIPTHAESDRMLAAEGESAEDRAQEAESTANEGRGFTASAHFEDGATDISIMLSNLDLDYGVPGHGHEEGEDEHEDEDEHEGEEEGEHEGEEDHEEAEDVSIDLVQQSVHLRLNHAPKNLPIDTLRVDMTATDFEQKELEGAVVGLQFEQSSLHLRLEGAFELTDWRSLVGVEFRDVELDTIAEGHHGYIPSSEQSQVGLFAFAERDNGVWLTELAAHIGSVDLTAIHDDDDEPNDEASYDVTNLSVGLGRRLNGAMLIGGSLSATERAPSQVELFAEGEHVAAARHETGDSDLAKETALATELYLRRSWAGGSLRAAVFQNDFDDFIYLARNASFFDPDEPELQGYNYRQQGAELSGYEIEVRSDLSIAGKTWAGRLSFSEVSGELDNGDNLPALPPQKIGLGLSTEFGTIDLDFDIDYAAEQSDTGADELETDGYTSLDISVGWSPVAYEGLRLTAALRNATDEEIRHHTSPLKDLLPEAGRDFRLTARWQF